MKTSARASALVFLLLCASAASAEITFSGYLKDIEQYSAGQLDDRPYNLNTSRLRLTVDASTSVFRAHVDFDNQLAATALLAV